ncbi:hypothetical protein RHSIM_Rhsim04G0152400 [Rhododendron simsii]|uniref:Uncharacterized protein n=1 Tax=Rhododendron simsii TaxID=118357 RepID=A0A834H1J8_RHOSS|nr:hypothetical protein RHSIM_Rhsim04G0152400 [Rhododendron simsii]
MIGRGEKEVGCENGSFDNSVVGDSGVGLRSQKLEGQDQFEGLKLRRSNNLHDLWNCRAATINPRSPLNTAPSTPPKHAHTFLNRSRPRLSPPNLSSGIYDFPSSRLASSSMVKTMLLKVGIALVLMLLALGFTAEARRPEARWLSVHFGKLPKGAPVPPSAPSRRTNSAPPKVPLPLDNLVNSRMVF